MDKTPQCHELEIACASNAWNRSVVVSFISSKFKNDHFNSFDKKISHSVLI